MARDKFTWSKKKTKDGNLRLAPGSLLKVNGVVVAQTQQDAQTGKWFWYGGYGPCKQNTAHCPVASEVEAMHQAAHYVKTAMETEAANA